MNESLYGTDKERGFKRIYDLYADNVYRLCFSYMKNKMDAEDIMQAPFFIFLMDRNESIG